MRVSQRIRLFSACLMVLAMTAGALPLGANAAASTITAEMRGCGSVSDLYQVQLSAGAYFVPSKAFPASVLLTFADGRSLEAKPLFVPNGSAQYYYLMEVQDTALVSATTQFDTGKYPNYSFVVTGQPCAPAPTTATITGSIAQRGNEKPVADLTVCLAEIGLCTTTDATGSFAFEDVAFGTYTLTSNGQNWKPLSTTVTVGEGGSHVDLIQQKGGGN